MKKTIMTLLVMLFSMASQAQTNYNPMANPATIVDAGKMRFTVKKSHTEWFELLTNGDAETPWGDLANVAYNDNDNNYKICAWGKENNSNPFPATIEDDGTGNHIFVVHAAKCKKQDDSSAWENQFWIEAPQEFQAGTQIKISFRYKASQNCNTHTQVHHQEPSNYLHWEGIGDVYFTTEWQYLEKTITINDSQAGAWNLCFNLNPDVKTATNFYFDDLSWQVQKEVADLPEITPNPTIIVLHGKERDYLTADSNGNPREEQIGTGNTWDNQFFVTSNRTLKAGEETIISFDYYASRNAKTSTECHNVPGEYMWWSCIGDVNFTTEKQHIEKIFTVPSEADGMHCIAISMAHIKEACNYTLTNFVWKLKDDTETLIDCEETKNFYVKEGANSSIVPYEIYEEGDPQIIINEIMQSNIDCIMDDQNEFPDSWVEIYNAGSASDDLINYKIGLTANADEAWPLSSAKIKPNSFELIYCDKVGNKNHTDFRLESDKGGAVYLFKNGEIVDSYTNIPAQPAPNIAYGRKNESSTEIGWQKSPTPKKANCGTLCTELLGDPVFSVPGYVESTASNIELNITLPEGYPSGAKIRYTTDGSEPTENSAIWRGTKTFTTSTVVRAKVFCDGYLSPRSVSQSYIIHGRNVTLPVISIATDNSFFYDSQKGIYVEGNYDASTKNYQYDWRRPVNIEVFMPDKEESVINQLGETRVCGAASRGAQLKSLVVYANKRFGKKRLKYEFFPTQRPGLNKFKSFMIRNAGNDFDYLYMRDAAIQRSFAEHVDLDWQAWRPAIFYFNGKYMGMLNIRERSNDDNIWENYDGLEDIDMVENYSELKTGTWDAYNAFKDFYTETGHTYAEYDEQMDINEYQNLMLMHLFYSNLDFPGNNIVQWKPRTDESKWRWVAKDTDFGLGLYGQSSSYNTIEWLYDNNYDSNHAWANTADATRLFRRLMDIDQFKWEFLDKVAIYTGTFLSATKVNALLDEMHDEISFEYPYHRELINRWWPNYSDELTNAKTWMNQRTQNFFNQLKSKYGLGNIISTAKINNQLQNSDLEMLSVTVNDIPLEEATFNGRLFNGRTLNIDGVCIDDTKEVRGWTVSVNGQSSKTYEGKTLTYTPSNVTSITINAIIGESTGIENVTADNKATLNESAIYSANGIKNHTLQKGLNIVKDKNGNVIKIIK